MMNLWRVLFKANIYIFSLPFKKRFIPPTNSHALVLATAAQNPIITMGTTCTYTSFYSTVQSSKLKMWLPVIYIAVGECFMSVMWNRPFVVRFSFRSHKTQIVGFPLILCKLRTKVYLPSTCWRITHTHTQSYVEQKCDTDSHSLVNVFVCNKWIKKRYKKKV